MIRKRITTYLDDYVHLLRGKHLRDHVCAMLLDSKEHRRAFDFLQQVDRHELEYWAVWYHFARYLVYHNPIDMKETYALIMQEDFAHDAWFLYMIARYAYEVAGQPMIGLRYLRRAIALQPELSWQSEYAIFCYYTQHHDESRRYLEQLIEVGYHRENSYLFSLYVDLLIRQENFAQVLHLYRTYWSKAKLPTRDLVLQFKLEELFGNKRTAQRIAKKLFRERAFLDEINQAFLLLYFIKEKKNSYADKLYQELTSNHSLAILARILYATQHHIQDIYTEREWYQQKFRLYSFVDHSFLLYINSGMSELHRLAVRLHHQSLQAHQRQLHYDFPDLWQRYGAELFFLGERPILSAQFVRIFYQLQARQYALADMHLHGISITYRTRLIFVGSARIPFGYYLLRGELALGRKQWQRATHYYAKALKKLSMLDSYYREYFAWLLIECVRIFIDASLMYQNAKKTSKQLRALRLFDAEHLTLLLHRLRHSQHQGSKSESQVWQALVEEQLLQRQG